MGFIPPYEWIFNEISIFPDFSLSVHEIRIVNYIAVSPFCVTIKNKSILKQMDIFIIIRAIKDIKMDSIFSLVRGN